MVTKYIMFPFSVFKHWEELLIEENRNARIKYKVPKELTELLAFFPIFLP